MSEKSSGKSKPEEPTEAEVKSGFKQAAKAFVEHRNDPKARREAIRQALRKTKEK